MKKIIFIICILSVILCGCTVTENKGAANGNESDISSSEKAESINAETVRPEIKKLIDNNVYVIMKVTNFLADYDTEVIGGHYYAVKNSPFNTTAEMKEFLENTYTSSAVSVILSKIDGIYNDVEGKFCVDINRLGGKGYYVDWSGYTFNVNSVDDTECNFTVNAKINEPGETVTAFPYTKNITAVKENGKWLLTGEFY